MALILKRASAHAYGTSGTMTITAASRVAAATQGREPVLDPPLVARLDAESLLKSVNA
jgi:hypothetical protein